MQILTVDECNRWLAERSLLMQAAPQWGHDHHIEIPAQFRGHYFDVPSEARRVWSLAHMLTEWFPCQSSMLLLSAVTMFEPHELEAFLLSRRSQGDLRWIDGVPGGATPGHLFSDDSSVARRDVRELLSLMMAYMFQGYLVRADGAVVVWLGDGVVDIEAGNAVELEASHRIAETLNLQAGEWAHELMRRRTMR